MPDIFHVENLICQLVSWPSVPNECSWQQWAPILAGYLAALVYRAFGAGRLTAFIGGSATFFLVAIGLSIAPLHAPFAYLFLAPVAFISALLGLICGDIYRHLTRRFGGARSTVD
jgi:hypothetical protein